VVAVVDKAEAVPVDMVARVAVAQAAQVVVVQVVREARVVVNAVRHRAQRPGSQPRCHNKTPRLMAHGVCGRG